LGVSKEKGRLKVANFQMGVTPFMGNHIRDITMEAQIKCNST